MAINAVLAISAESNVCPSTGPSPNPLRRGSRGCGIFIHQIHAAEGGSGSIMVGMFVSLWLVVFSQPNGLRC